MHQEQILLSPNDFRSAVRLSVLKWIVDVDGIHSLCDHVETGSVAAIETTSLSQKQRWTDVKNKVVLHSGEKLRKAMKTQQSPACLLPSRPRHVPVFTSGTTVGRLTRFGKTLTGELVGWAPTRG